MAAATDFFHVMTTARTRLELLTFLPFEVILVAGLVALLVLVRLGGTVGAERASHNATATNFLYMVATTRARLHIFALLPFKVVLLARLVAMLVLMGAGGTIGAEVVAAHLALDRQVTTNVFLLDLMGEYRNPVTIGLRAEAQ